MRRNSPPALACWLLESVVPAPYREAMLGDLIEEYSLRVESTSPSTASRWFWSQACRSVPSMAWSWLRSRDCLMSMSIALGVYIFMEMSQLAANLTIARLVAPEPKTDVVLAPVVFLTRCAIGGCVAARIRRGAAIFLALMIMITAAVSIDLRLCTIPVPWWYSLGFFSLGPLAVVTVPVVFGVRAPGAAEPVK
jgi:hypothetical protein